MHNGYLLHKWIWIWFKWRGSPAYTSELRGEQQSLEQRVEVAGTPLVLDATQIAFPTRGGWFVSPLCNSAPGGGRGEKIPLLFLEKIPKHPE